MEQGEVVHDSDACVKLRNDKLDARRAQEKAGPELYEAMRDLVIFYGDDAEARDVLRSDFTGPEPLLMDDDALRESVWDNARAALLKASGGKDAA
jgi:hypothetical protein